MYNASYRNDILHRVRNSAHRLCRSIIKTKQICTERHLSEYTIAHMPTRHCKHRPLETQGSNSKYLIVLLSLQYKQFHIINHNRTHCLVHLSSPKTSNLFDMAHPQPLPLRAPHGQLHATRLLLNI